MDRGIVLTGGGAQLAGLDRRLASGTGMAVHVAEHPAHAVVLGVGRAVESFDALARVLMPEPRH